jgi:hypothetical protein
VLTSIPDGREGVETIRLGIGLARAPVGLLQVCASPAVLHTFLQRDTPP